MNIFLFACMSVSVCVFFLVCCVCLFMRLFVCFFLFVSLFLCLPCLFGFCLVSLSVYLFGFFASVFVCVFN